VDLLHVIGFHVPEAQTHSPGGDKTDAVVPAFRDVHFGSSAADDATRSTR